MAPSAITILESDKPVVNRQGLSWSHDRRHLINADGVSARLIGETLKNRIDSIDQDICEPGEEDAFFVADMGDVYRQHLRWKMNLKRVKPFYAVKCNPDPRVLRLLAELGTGFDCASKQEIQQIRDMGVDSTRIIYAQPCKTNSFIRYAKHQQVKQMTFDNAEELYKIKQNFPAAELYLRIFTDDSSSLCRLSLKFGAAPQDAAALLELAKDLDLSVVGVSFHVGSGATDPNAFIKAIKDARFVFDQAALVGYHLGTLDIGGGFSDDTFEMMASVISPCLDLYFPPQIRIIGEPGRYYVSKAFQLACNVIARRPLEDPITGVRSYMLYVNDGVYGNFSSMMFDHQNPVPKILRRGHHFLHGRAASEKVEENKSEGMIQYSIWGPTCDGIDCISASCWLPGTLGVGDWLYFENMGAYTMCSATRFNGFTNEHDVIYVSSEAGATALLDVN